jgi:hypothetical protein
MAFPKNDSGQTFKRANPPMQIGGSTPAARTWSSAPLINVEAGRK